jgi:hypothetical protein
VSTGPYSCVYGSIITDPKFDAVYPNDHHLATWLRLLLQADATYPAPAPIPRSASRASLTALVDARIIDRIGTDHYVIHGMKAERDQRSSRARDAAWARWSGLSSSDAAALRGQSDGNAEHMLVEYSRVEQSRAEQSSPGQDALALLAQGREPALDAYQRIFPSVSANALHFLDDLIGEFGQEAVASAIGYESTKGRDRLLTRVKTNLLLRARDQEQRKVAEYHRPVTPIKVVEPEPDLTPEEIEAQAEEWRASHK